MKLNASTIIIIVLILGAVGYFFYKRKASISISTNPSPSPEPEPTPVDPHKQVTVDFSDILDMDSYPWHLSQYGRGITEGHVKWYLNERKKDNKVVMTATQAQVETINKYKAWIAQYPSNAKSFKAWLIMDAEYNI